MVTPTAPLQALILDSWYDTYRGVVILVRVVDGVLRPKQKVRFMATRQRVRGADLGAFAPLRARGAGARRRRGRLRHRDHQGRRRRAVGDTITDAGDPAVEPLPGFQAVKPMVFAGIFPTDSARYDDLRDALEKLRLNDSSFSFEPETSAALGFGFRCGFLGLLHMEIVQERLEREYNLDLITTAPTVRYSACSRTATIIEIDNPAKFPSEGDRPIEEPIIAATIHMPQEYVGGSSSCARRGADADRPDVRGRERVIIRYELPLAEVVFGFYDRLKTCSRGYASLDYEPTGYREADLVRLDLLVNGDRVDALSMIVHREGSYNSGGICAAR